MEISNLSHCSGQTSEPARLEASRTLTKADRRDRSGRGLRHKWSSVAFTSLITKFTHSHLNKNLKPLEMCSHSSKNYL